MIACPPPYPKMKDSGVPWLGKIPTHWAIRRLKQICRLAYGAALATDVRQDGTIPVFGSNGHVGFHNLANTKSPCIVIGRKGSFGKVNYSRDPVFAIDTTFFVDNRFSSAHIRWLYFLLGWLRLDEVSKDSAVPGLDREDTYQNLAALPPLPEQAAIVRFLDHADRRIRRYIRAKQKLITLLEEQKQAIIHQAMTGQVDVRTGQPYPAYKPSGVEWLGNVPVHWEVRRNGRLFVQRNETGFPELPILEVSLNTGIRIRDFGNSDRKQIMAVRSEYKRAVKGDIAYNMMRMWQGAVGVIPVDGLVSPAYVVARPLKGTESRYFSALFRTNVYMAEVDKYSHGIVKDRNRLYWEDFKQMPTPYPPPDEQGCIVRYLDKTTDDIDTAVARGRQEIDLLREYRTRLITDVVTGKLDVRSAAARLPDEIKEPEPLDQADPLIDGEEEPIEATTTGEAAV